MSVPLLPAETIPQSRKANKQFRTLGSGCCNAFILNGRLAPRKFLPPLDDYIAVQSVELHQVSVPTRLLRSNERRARAAEQDQHVLALARRIADSTSRQLD